MKEFGFRKMFGRFLCRVSIVVVGVGVVFSSFAAGYTDSGWAYQEKITLNTTSSGANVAQNVLNFPVLVRLTNNNFAYSRSLVPGGGDIRFAKSNGTPLKYEIEQWNNPQSGNSEIWVKVDTVYGNNATQCFYMYWGKSGTAGQSNGEAVFDTVNGYLATWHLDERGNGTANEFKDATVNANNGQGGSGTANQVPVQRDGIVGHCQHFDTLDGHDLIDCGAKMPLNDSLTAFTLHAWFKNDAQGTAFIAGNGGDFGTSGWALQEGMWGDNKLVARINQTGTPFSAMPDAGTWSSWHHIVISFPGNGSAMFAFVDGITYTGTTTLLSTGPMGWNFMIGGTHHAAGYQYTNGYIDEVRALKKSVDSNWAKLCYQNQKPAQLLVQTPVIDSPWISTSALPITHIMGSQMPLSQIAQDTFNIWNGGTQGTLAYTITLKHSSSWLSITPGSGSSASGVHNKVSISYNMTALSMGDFSDTIVITAANSLNGTVSIPVHIAIGTQSFIEYSPQSILRTLGGDYPSYTGLEPDSIEIWNGKASDSLDFTLSIKNSSAWLSLSATSGKAIGSHQKIAVNYSGENIFSEVNTDTIVITSASGILYIPVSIGTGVAVLEKQKQTKLSSFLKVGPNPARRLFTLEYTVPATYSGKVTLSICDIQGREVGQGTISPVTTERIKACWDGKGKFGFAAQSGIYFARLLVDNGKTAKKVLCSVRFNYFR